MQWTTGARQDSRDFTRTILPMLLIALVSPLAGCAGLRGVEGVRVETLAGGLVHPLYLTAPASDPRLFIVEQPGIVRIVKNGQLLPAPFLDLTARVSYGGERGLLSIAFHPRYASNGWFYVNYTDQQGDTRVERFSVSQDPDIADPSSGVLILGVDQPYANHNGGLVMFGPDGMLYIGMGDGGGGGDPQGNGQDRGTLLGDLLRIDVDAGSPYAIPAGNPFAGTPGMRGEIWAWGLRNPWRFAFDKVSGLLFIADVGQNRWEEVNVAPAAAPGLNYGWNITEGAHCYGTVGCNQTGLVAPALEYSHAEGCSVTGGYVYRGSKIPALAGRYVYADYCEGWIRVFTYRNGKAVDPRVLDVGDVGNVLSFGEDAFGELYILSGNGNVYRLVGSS